MSIAGALALQLELKKSYSWSTDKLCQISTNATFQETLLRAVKLTEQDRLG